MITITQAILSLQPFSDFQCGITSDDITWLSTNVTQPTEAEIQTEVTRLQAEYDSLAYARSRKQEYDKLNQWEMQFDDNRDGTTTWVDSINEIKNKFPKE